MDPVAVNASRRRIRLETAGLLFLLTLMLAGCGTVLVGPAGFLLGPVALLGLLALEVRAPIGWLLRRYAAQPVHRNSELGRLFDALRRRAGLSDKVWLFITPARQLNAFTIGHSSLSAIVIAAPLLEQFSRSEVTGILAHELSHVRNEDTRWMTIATGLTSMVGQFALIIVLYTLLIATLGESPGRLVVGMLVGTLTPPLALHLLARLSRTREFAADLGATELSGSPDGLISALGKIERYYNRFSLRWLVRAPGAVQTHPPTAERITRLLACRARQPRGISYQRSPRIASQLSMI